MTIQDTGSAIHDFLLNHPIGRQIAAHTRYGPGHPVHDAHQALASTMLGPMGAGGMRPQPPPQAPAGPPPGAPPGMGGLEQSPAMMGAGPPGMPGMAAPQGPPPSVLPTDQGPINPHLLTALRSGQVSPRGAMPAGGRPAPRPANKPSPAKPTAPSGKPRTPVSKPPVNRR